MLPHRLAAVALSTFLIAIFALQWWQLSTYPWQLWALLGSFGPLGAFGIFFRSTRTIAILLLAITLALPLAFLTVARTTHVSTEQTIDWYATGSSATIIGTIAEPPEHYQSGLRSIVAVRSMWIGKVETQVDGRVLMTDPSGWPPYVYGDEVEATGILERPGEIEGFRYDHYLSKSNIYALLRRARVRSTGRNTGQPILRFLSGSRAWIEAQITALFPEPHASLLAGLLVGSRQNIPLDVQDAFKRTGLTHLVAISGYNITLLITVVGVFLFWIPPRFRLLPSILFIACFTILVGASASVVRAAIMGVLGLMAIQAGRGRASRLAMLWTAALMLLWNPKQLWYDPGFQLSFLALLGVTELSPLLERPLAFLPGHFGIRESLRLTLAAQIATIPWSLFQFGTLSLIAPLSNLLAPPAVPIAMASGFIAVVVSALSPLLGRLCALPALLSLEWILRSSTTLAALPGAALSNVSTSATITTASYMTLIVAVVLHEYRSFKTTRTA